MVANRLRAAAGCRSTGTGRSNGIWLKCRLWARIENPGGRGPALEIIVAHALLDELGAAFHDAALLGEAQHVEPHLLVVARIVALVNLMTAAEFGADRIPDELEELDA